jgi:hypothetical protein
MLIAVDNQSSSLESLQGSGRTASNVRNPSGPIQFNRMKVSVLTDREQYPTSQMSRTDSFIATESHGGYKAQEVILDANVESGQEK